MHAAVERAGVSVDLWGKAQYFTFPLRFTRFEPAVRAGYSIAMPKQGPPSFPARDFVARWGRHVRGIIAKTAGEGPPVIGPRVRPSRDMVGNLGPVFLDRHQRG